MAVRRLRRLAQLRRRGDARHRRQRSAERRAVLLAPGRLSRHLRLRRRHGAARRAAPAAPHLNIISYLKNAWPDFIDHQLRPFQSLEIFLGIGNHEPIFPQTHKAYLEQFEKYLNSPRLAGQRERDHDAGGFRTYYHWVMNGSVDFISLDNASGNAFDKEQMAWIRARLAEDRKSRAIATVVVGMHEALPGSKGMSHSMCDSPAGIQSGREVYNLLWDLQQAGKKVYLLASHSHFVMDDVYNTPYWKDQVLPGWIVGTAGAVRYRLPPGQTGSSDRPHGRLRIPVGHRA